MITKESAYKTSDGKACFTLEEAQRHELTALLDLGPDDDGTRVTSEYVLDRIMANPGKVVDILTTGPNSRVKARKANGGTKKRKATVANGTPAPVVA